MGYKIGTILGGLCGAALLYILVFKYVPDLRHELKKGESTNQTLVDTLTRRELQLLRTNTELTLKNNVLTAINQANLNWQRQWASMLPRIQGQVGAQSITEQRLFNLESLYRSGLLPATDTVALKAPATYSPVQHTALSVELRYCDSLRHSDSLLVLDFARLQGVSRLQSDSLTTYRDWSRQNQRYAEQKGWFTGRTVQLRSRSLHPPFVK